MKTKHCALITGSSSGIGLGIAEVFARNGISVVMHGIEPLDHMMYLANRLAEKTEQSISAISLDLSQQRNVEKYFQSHADQLHDVDILVNNAGVQFVSPVETFPMEKWNLLLQLHLTIPFFLTQFFLPKMREKKFGRLINISLNPRTNKSINA